MSFLFWFIVAVAAANICAMRQILIDILNSK